MNAIDVYLFTILLFSLLLHPKNIYIHYSSLIFIQDAFGSGFRFTSFGKLFVSER